MTFAALSNLQQRLIIGIPGAALFVASVLYSSHTYFALFFVLALLAQREFYTMLRNAGYHSASTHWLVVGAVCNALFYFTSSGAIAHRWLLPAVVAIFIPLLLSLYKKGTNLLPEAGYGLLGLVYVALPFTLFHGVALSAGGAYNAYIVLSFMLMLWASDTGAYIFGKLFGRTKLFPSVSPGKTWEGSIGGLITSLAVAWALHRWLQPAELPIMLGMAAIIVVFGSYGDLVESKMKRVLQIKDSSGFLPGHGGLLDRFDGLLIAAPMVFVFLKFVC